MDPASTRPVEDSRALPFRFPSRTYLIMASDSCSPSRLRCSRSLQPPMMLSRAAAGTAELDMSTCTSCRELGTRGHRSPHSLDQDGQRPRHCWTARRCS